MPGKEAILREAFRQLKPEYMIESDFIDDPKRPGASSYPWDIVENQIKLVAEGVVDEDYVYKINVDVPVKIYGISPP